MSEGAAKVLVVVIAGEGKDGPAAGQKVAEDGLPVLDGLAQPIGPGQLAEQVARDQQNVDLLLPAVVADALDGLAEVESAVDPPEAVAEMPVGGVEEAHNPWNDGGWGPAGQ